MLNKKYIGFALVSCVHFSALAKNEKLETFGDVAQIALPLTAGVIALYKGDDDGFIQLVEGAIWTSASTHLLKQTINAERPNGGNYSFPSGHTSAAAQGAAFLQFSYGWEYGLPAYAVATVVGYSRVESDHHYWRDVIAGAALATSIQYAITSMGYSATNWVVAPYKKNDEVGLYAQVTF